MRTHLSDTADLREILDRHLGAFRLKIIVICALVAIVDGFDVQAMAFVAPVIKQAWSMDSSLMGVILMSGVAGLMLGTMAMGPLSDRLGRRRVILMSIFAFSAFSLATTTAASAAGLILWRLLTGIGLGGALIGGLSLIAEIAPSRHRATLIMLMFIGFPIGGSIGGVLSAVLIEHFGWQGVFVLGGALPLALGLAIAWQLPESPAFLLASKTESARMQLARLVARIDPARRPRPGEVFLLRESVSPPKAQLSELFRHGRLAGTLLLWSVSFFNMIVMYLLITWLPTIFLDRGLPLSRAIHVAVAFNLGGVLGSLALGYSADRFGAARPLAVAYAMAAAVIWAVAQSGTLPQIFALTALAGAGVIGSQFCIYAVAANFYPTAIRSTGSGWAIGVGRSGALLGPMLGGAALGAGWSAADLLHLSIIPPAVCLVLLLRLSIELKRCPRG